MVAKAEPRVGGDPPPRNVSTSSTTLPGGPAGDLLTKGPIGEASDHEGISSAVRTKGSVMELAGIVKKQPIGVLWGSGPNGNFISDHTIMALKLKSCHIRGMNCSLWPMDQK